MGKNSVRLKINFKGVDKIFKYDTILLDKGCKLFDTLCQTYKGQKSNINETIGIFLLAR